MGDIMGIVSCCKMGEGDWEQRCVKIKNVQKTSSLLI